MKEYEIGNETKNQINTILNNFQSKIFSNSNASYNDEFINSKIKNLDVNVFRSFGLNDNNINDNKDIINIKQVKDIKASNNINNIKTNLNNDYSSQKFESIYNTNNMSFNNNYLNQNVFIDNKNNDFNFNYSYYEIKNIIRSEFEELILPYQKQLYNNNNEIQEKINDVETRLKGLINSKSMENINESAQMINACMKDYYINSNSNGNTLYFNNKNNQNTGIENRLNLIVKNQYDNKFDIMERRINSMDSLLKTLHNTFNSNILDIVKSNQKRKENEEKKYVENSTLETCIKDIKSEILKIKSNMNSEINNIKSEQDNKFSILNEKINSQINDINNNLNNINNEIRQKENIENQNLVNNMKLLKGNLDNITGELFDLKSKINIRQLDNINKLDLESLKEINVYEINMIKDKVNYLENDISDIKELLKENNNQCMEVGKNYNDLELKLNDLKNENLIDKINNLEEFVKSLNKAEEANDNFNDNLNKDELNNDNMLGFVGSRRQKRNISSSQNKNSNINTNSNNNNKAILDEKTMKMLKQLENINLENINFKLDNFYNDYKIAISKVESHDNAFTSIEEKEKMLNQQIDELNKKIKDYQNRLELLELKNYGINSGNNNNANNFGNENKDLNNKNPFGPKTDIVNDNNNNINVLNNNDFNIDDIDLDFNGNSKLSDNKNISDTKINNNNMNNNNTNNNNMNNNNVNNNNVNNNMVIANNNNEDDILNKIMGIDQNNYKDQKQDTNRTHQSNQDFSISNVIKPILDSDKNKSKNDNNEKGEKSEISDFDDFDDIDNN